jgi:hypothetical protein
VTAPTEVVAEPDCTGDGAREAEAVEVWPRRGEESIGERELDVGGLEVVGEVEEEAVGGGGGGGGMESTVETVTAGTTAVT